MAQVDKFNVAILPNIEMAIQIMPVQEGLAACSEIVRAEWLV